MACIVATGLSTKPVNDVAIVRGVGTSDVIPNTASAGLVSSLVLAGDFPQLAQYNLGVDFQLSSDCTSVVWLNGGQAPKVGNTYYVTYRTPKVPTDYDKGVIYTSLQDVRTDMGSELINGVVTPITAAAKFAFDNGASAVLLIQAVSAAQTDLENALDAAKLEDVDLIIAPQMCNTTLDQYVRAHVLTQSAPSNRHERVWFRSADGMSDAVTTIAAAAQGMATERVTVMAPPAFNATLHDSVTDNDEQLLFPSGYMAAMYAGVVTDPANDPATPMTRQPLVGIDNLSTFNYQETDKDILGGAGVTVVDNFQGVFKIRQGLTTDTTNVNTVTQSVVFIKDNIAKDLRTLLDQTYIGSKIDASLPSRMYGTIAAFLKQKVNDDIIVDWGNIIVQQDSTDPRTMNVSFRIYPVYPTEYVDVTISLAVA
jgi:hypothetical protein